MIVKEAMLWMYEFLFNMIWDVADEQIWVFLSKMQIKTLDFVIAKNLTKRMIPLPGWQEYGKKKEDYYIHKISYEYKMDDHVFQTIILAIMDDGEYFWMKWGNSFISFFENQPKSILTQCFPKTTHKILKMRK